MTPEQIYLTKIIMSTAVFIIAVGGSLVGFLFTSSDINEVTDHELSLLAEQPLVPHYMVEREAKKIKDKAWDKKKSSLQIYAIFIVTGLAAAIAIFPK